MTQKNLPSSILPLTIFGSESISSTRSTHSSKTWLLTTHLMQMYIIPISTLEFPINHIQPLLSHILLNCSCRYVTLLSSSLIPLTCVSWVLAVDENFINRTSVSLCSIKFSHYFKVMSRTRWRRWRMRQIPPSRIVQCSHNNHDNI